MSEGTTTTMSPADMMAMMNGNGGMNSWSNNPFFYLIFMWMFGNGFGNWGNRADAAATAAQGTFTRAELADGLNAQTVQDDLRQISAGVAQGTADVTGSVNGATATLNSAVNGGFAGVQQSMCSGFSGVNSNINRATADITGTINGVGNDINSNVTNGTYGVTGAINQTGNTLNNAINNGVYGVTGTINQTANTMNSNMTNGFNGLNSAITNGVYGVTGAINSTTNDVLGAITQNTFAQSAGVNAINNNIGTLKYEMAQNCCDLKNTMHAEGEATRALIQANTIQDLRDKLADKASDLQAAQLTLSNANQTQTILNSLGKFVPTCACSLANSSW